jgi:nucleotidyltransferase/DNA polymerase involved in DNA repair
MQSNDRPLKAIVHVDGDAFFASCEIAQNEAYRGKPVVTGQEKGMAIAVSYEAKARGISRGMLMSDIRKICPDAIILSGNYELYKICSRRMCAIVRRHAPFVEEYSVDECFADISSSAHSWSDAIEISWRIKKDLERDLGMSFSLGLAPTKTLAKVASKWKKPAGFTAMQEEDIEGFLEKAPIGAVWGIGASSSARLQKLGIKTALEFTKKGKEWIEESLSKPHQELWYELRGVSMHDVRNGDTEKHKSIRATRTFKPPTADIHFILSEFSKNAEKACAKLRSHGLQAGAVYFYLKTQTFTYRGHELRFDLPVSTPSSIMNHIQKLLPEIYRKGTDYRATGVVLNAISPAALQQPDLFGLIAETDKKTALYQRIDALFKKFGRRSLFIASSLRSRKRDAQPRKMLELSFRLGIPFWGDAS